MRTEIASFARSYLNPEDRVERRYGVLEICRNLTPPLARIVERNRQENLHALIALLCVYQIVERSLRRVFARGWLQIALGTPNGRE